MAPALRNVARCLLMPVTEVGIMRKELLVLLVALAALITTAPAEARHRHGSHVRLGFSVGLGGWWGWPYAGYSRVYAPLVDGASAPEVGAVDADVSPEHARVYLDGALIGTADDFDGFPGYLLLHPGRYSLEFRLPGYRTAALDLDVRKGSFHPIDLDLERVPGEAATPWFDRPEKPPANRVYGHPPGLAREPERPHPDMTLRPEVGRSRAGERETRAPVLGAALDIVVQPDKASVYLDGEFLGTGSELGRLERGIAISPGAHELEVMAPGFATRRLELEVPVGDRQQVVVELEADPGQ